MTRHPLESQAIARICHDLISPIGAIGNGVELLGDVLGTSPELELVSQSAQIARNKINFFRVAFDGPSPNAALAGDMVAQTANAMFEAARMRVEMDSSLAPVARDDARLVYLLILCAENALPLGGHLAVRPQGAGWELAATGRRITIEPEYWAHVQTGAPLDEAPAARVHFPLARMALAEQARRLVVESSDTSLLITLS